MTIFFMMTVLPQVSDGKGVHAITPGDLTVIYNLTPLYKKGITGAGQKIAVAGESALNLQDIRDFRTLAGLPPSEPKVLLVPGSADPGFTDAEGEALLDVEYAGGGAPGATIVYVYAKGVDQALQYAVQLRIDWYLVTNLKELRLFHKAHDTLTFERFETSRLAKDDAELAN
jgi:subtilase family serine protease